jgi:hypothetical protein
MLVAGLCAEVSRGVLTISGLPGDGLLLSARSVHVAQCFKQHVSAVLDVARSGKLLGRVLMPPMLGI